ncbi:MAG: phage major tail protein, TP901-1 family [Rhizobiaceae bacterium]|nr:phage major tail protein, TP901-1 family [Rhizobiaceae bacterium]MBL4731178.1 phage major tail protein, TP901-1 family [Rhizobiaceae bacterium]
MTAQKGKDLLLKIDVDDVGSFETVAGIRSRQLSFNAETVDATDSESAGRWRELLAGAGLRSASLSGSGIFKDASSDEKIRRQFFDGLITPWQIIIPDFGVMEGLFQITSINYSGEHNSEIAFELTLQSAGQIAFTAV